MGTPNRPRRRAGFTLIELLVVIAIISIITGILLPVIFSVKEKARQGTVMDDYRQISSALARYQLENHRYPDVLFGYAVSGSPMSQVKPVGSLYPLYINDSSVFTDPNNNITDPTQTQTIPVNALNSAGVLMPSSQTFYTADAFDIGPVLAANNTLASPTVYIARYQRAWTSYPPSPADANFSRQLANPNPSADTYVTCTTYHAGQGIGQGKVLVLFAGGNARTMDDSRFLPGGDTVTSVAAPTGGGNSPVQFWHVNP